VEVKPVLLDTNAYAAIKRGDAQATEIARYAAVLALNPIVLGELLSGFAARAREKANRDDLNRFLQSPRVIVLSVDQQTAEQYATIHFALRTAGRLMPSNDIWIAASALQHDMGVFTFDAHFGVIVGLRVVRSLADLAAQP
jgi:tRNA(fMet)-specific endonuclease VapC